MKKMFYALGISLLMFPAITNAAILKGGEEYTFTKNETVEDNLYIGGGMVNIAGNVVGDLVTAGGNVAIGGNVSEDLMVAGGTVIVLGEVGDDVRVVGGNVTISGSVEGDVVVAGGSVHIISTAKIKGDVVAAAGMVTIDGEVAGRVEMIGGALIINGSVTEGVKAKVEALTLGSGAQVGADVTYESGQEAKISTDAVVAGEVKFSQIEVPMKKHDKANWGAFVGVAWLVKLVMQLVFAFVLLWLMPKTLLTIVRRVHSKFGSEMLRGFVTIVTTPIAVMLLFVSIIGVLLAIPIALLYASLMIISSAISGVVLGSLFWNWTTGDLVVNWKTLLLGVIMMSILGLVPVIGWVVVVIVCLATFGAVVMELFVVAKEAS